MTETGKFSVIGGAGFIGTRLCRLLEAEHVPFSIIDLKRSNRFPDQSQFGDIRDPASFSDAVTGDAIFHLAAVHRDDIRPLSLYDDTNVTGTRHVCEAAEAQGINTIIFTSSVAIYGFAPADTGEDGAANPFNTYGRTKHEAEGVLRAWQAKDPENRKLVIVRPTVVFGEGNRGNVYNLLRQIASGSFVMIGNGLNRKSMAYVGNIAAFLRHTLTLDTGVHVFNYVDKPDFVMNDLVRLVRKTLRGKDSVGLRLPYWAGLAASYGFDLVARVTGRKFPVSSLRIKKFAATTAFASAAHDVAGFTAPTSLDQAMTQTLDYEFINHPADAEEFFTE